jgi:hypothetical protein
MNHRWSSGSATVSIGATTGRPPDWARKRAVASMTPKWRPMKTAGPGVPNATLTVSGVSTRRRSRM